jgi:hypothetical protein
VLCASLNQVSAPLLKLSLLMRILLIVVTATVATVASVCVQAYAFILSHIVNCLFISNYCEHRKAVLTSMIVTVGWYEVQCCDVDCSSAYVVADCVLQVALHYLIW